MTKESIFGMLFLRNFTDKYTSLYHIIFFFIKFRHPLITIFHKSTNFSSEIRKKFKDVFRHFACDAAFEKYVGKQPILRTLAVILKERTAVSWEKRQETNGISEILWKATNLLRMSRSRSGGFQTSFYFFFLFVFFLYDYSNYCDYDCVCLLDVFLEKQFCSYIKVS